MQHAARYGFIAQIMNDMAASGKFVYLIMKKSPCVKCGGPLVHGTRVCPRCMSKAAAFKRLFVVSQSHWKKLALGLVVLFASSGVSLSGPFFQKLLINGSLQPPDGQSATTYVLFSYCRHASRACTGGITSIFRGRIMANVSSGIAADLRKMVFDKTQQLSLGFLSSQRAGDIMNRITSDTDRIRHLIQELCTTAIFQLIMLVCCQLSAVSCRLATCRCRSISGSDRCLFTSLYLEDSPMEAVP